MAHRAHEHITQEAFSVSAELIGLPLARPWPRFWAMMIDLAIVGLLVNLGGSVLLGLALVWVFLRLSARAAAGGSGRMVRYGLRGFAALLLFAVGRSMWSGAEEKVEKVASAALVDAVAGPEKQASPLRATFGVGTGLIALDGVTDREAARPLARNLVRSMRGAGMKDAEIRSTLDDFAAKHADRPWMPALLGEMADSAGVRHAVPTPRTNADSVALAYAAAVRAHDTTRVHTLAPVLGSALAADSLKALHTSVGQLKAERNKLQGDLAQAKKSSESMEEMGLLHLIGRVADELGIGFGWTGLYFTAFLALWRGQTPGKRILGLRVVRLDGEKIGLWAAFERFGGYAASIFTGLLGFAQIFWDKNRQALHDKISETVVVRV
ncbi:MAG TPA: RDD family protein [Longimicrobiaceae bacterium]|nr:RDD family protein [Longimicrobiaceae bacterium]